MSKAVLKPVHQRIIIKSSEEAQEISGTSLKVDTTKQPIKFVEVISTSDLSKCDDEEVRKIVPGNKIALHQSQIHTFLFDGALREFCMAGSVLFILVDEDEDNSNK